MPAPARVAETLCQALQDLAERRGSERAIIGARRVRTWAELNDEVDTVAGGLLEQGVEPGQSVGMVLQRTPELVITFLAIARLGAVAVPVNHKLNTKWVLAQLEDLPLLVVDAKLAVTLPQLGSGNSKRVTPESLREARRPVGEFAVTITPDTPCYLNCTSGSTGRPKRAVTTHAHILANARATATASGQRADDVFWCLFAAFAHPHEFFHRSLISGATCVMIDTMSPRVVSKMVAKHRVSHLLVLPGFAELWLDSGLLAKGDDLPRLVEAGGSHVSPELHRRMGVDFRGAFVAVWGSTETTGVALVSSGQGGRPLESYAIKVVDEHGQAVEQGAVGELCIGGPAVVSSYCPASADAFTPFSNGWFHTGDLVRQDAAGLVHILGRRSTLIKVGGSRVFPGEVERVLREHPLVREVLVMGVPDRRRGEIPVAVVVAAAELEEDDSRLRDHCRAHLARYKVPRRFVFVSALPRLPGGKLDRQAVHGLVS